MNKEIKNKNTLQTQHLLLSFTEILHRELKASNRHATAKAYCVAVNSLTDFMGNENLLLKDITPGLIKSFDVYMIEKGLKPNTASTYIRHLRAIFNKAVKRGLICRPETNPFIGVHTKIYVTPKRAMTVEEIQRLAELQFREIRLPEISIPKRHGKQDKQKKQDKNLLQSQFGFLFCLHARGMSQKDMFFLKKTDIDAGSNHIEYTRSKTKQDMTVYITPPMKQIMNYFADITPKDSPYIFPFINPNKGDEYKQYQTAQTLQNRRLKRLQAMAGILKTITTHVARHTWATIAKRINSPIALISECLGHRDVKTTEIYLDSFDNPAKDMLSIRISTLLTGTKRNGKTKSARKKSEMSETPCNEEVRRP